MIALRAIWAFLRSVPWWVYAAVFTAGLLLVERDHYGDRRALAAEIAVRAEWSAAEARHGLELLSATNAAREAERRHRAAYAALSTRLTQENRDALAERDAVLADAAAGRLRLRDKFRCPAAAGVPGTPDGAGGGDGAGAAILSREDAEFLVRLGAEADDAARRLTACQTILAIDRSPPTE